MRLAVVCGCTFVFCDSYCDLLAVLVDHQLPIYDHELYVAEVLIDVLEVSGYDAHIIGSGIGLCYCPRCCLGCLDCCRYVVQIIVCLHARISFDGMRLAVVCDSVLVFCDSYRDLFAVLVDHQLSVYNHELYIRKVLVCVLEICCNDAHIIGSGVGLCYCPRICFCLSY